MEPSKLQKNATFIADLKKTRQAILELHEGLSAKYNSNDTNEAIKLLKQANYALLDRLVELGVTVKLEDGTS